MGRLRDDRELVAELAGIIIDATDETNQHCVYDVLDAVDAHLARTAPPAVPGEPPCVCPFPRLKCPACTDNCALCRAVDGQRMRLECKCSSIRAATCGLRAEFIPCGCPCHRAAPPAKPGTGKPGGGE